MEELPLPTCAIQLLGEELSTDEAASAELHEAEAVHRARNSRRLFKAAPTTPCVCREQQLETGVSNKRLKHMLEFYSTGAVRPSQGCSVPRCCTRRRLCGREPLGPDPHTTLDLTADSDPRAHPCSFTSGPTPAPNPRRPTPVPVPLGPPLLPSFPPGPTPATAHSCSLCPFYAATCGRFTAVRT